MSIALVRVDDRLIHGQVTVGWVHALGAKRIVLVDDNVRANEWEREIYSLGVPPDLDAEFVSVDEAARAFPAWEESSDRAIILLADVDAIVRLCGRAQSITKINLGGLHDGSGRTERLAYVYLSNDEAEQLRDLSERGVEVTAQDVPTARPVPLTELL